MNKITVALALLLPLTASAAVTTYETARVESVVPQLEKTRIQGQCRLVEVRETRANSGEGVGGAILGGVVGGLLGSQIGGGSGKNVATAAGAITGAIVGGNMDKASTGTTEVVRTQRICEPDSWGTRVTGYLVTYDYKGQRASYLADTEPGSTIEMRVTAEPVIR